MCTEIQPVTRKTNSKQLFVLFFYNIFGDEFLKELQMFVVFKEIEYIV